MLRICFWEGAQHVAEALCVGVSKTVHGFESLVQLPEFDLHFNLLLHVQ